MAAVILQYLVLHKEVDMKFERASVMSDNAPTVMWSTHMVENSKSHQTGHLLRGIATTQRASQAGPITLTSIPGVENSMSNVASWSFGQNQIPDTSFLSLLTSTSPLPQQQH